RRTAFFVSGRSSCTRRTLSWASTLRGKHDAGLRARTLPEACSRRTMLLSRSGRWLFLHRARTTRLLSALFSERYHHEIDPSERPYLAFIGRIGHALGLLFPDGHPRPEHALRDRPGRLLAHLYHANHSFRP